MSPERFSLPELVTQFGDVTVQTGDIPYAEKFDHLSGSMSIATFVLGLFFCDPASGHIDVQAAPEALRLHPSTLHIMGSAARQHELCAAFSDTSRGRLGTRNYAFTNIDAGESAASARMIRTLLTRPNIIDVPMHRRDAGPCAFDETASVSSSGVVADVIPASPSTGRHCTNQTKIYSGLRQPQFFVGAPGSGAPMHYHEDAVNVLAYGRKTWYLLPPRAAEYSTIPIAEYVTEVLPSLAGDATPLRCVQEAHDLMYVPRGWGHAVLNLETSVGYALEFQSSWQY